MQQPLGYPASIDENAHRLLTNHRLRFPELYCGVTRIYANQQAADTDVLAWLLGPASLTIGLEHHRSGAG